MDLLPMTKVEVLVKDENLDKTIKAIVDVPKTGKIRDGKIFVYDVAGALRIRTGEKDESAI